MILLLLAAQQTIPTPATPAPSAIQAGPIGPPDPADARFNQCLELTTSDPAKAEADAGQWRQAGGGFAARQCLGIAYSNEARWPAAAAEFEAAAKDAEAAKDPRSARYWAQAGNAWLAAGDAVRARDAIDAALAGGTLTDEQRGEARLDRARALVAAGDMPGARTDIDQALAAVPSDSLAWLLSATLARRMHDLPRAQKDIAEALKRSPQEAPVQLEAGNIAALAGDDASAKAAWQQAITLAPSSPAAASAQTALDQFGAPATP